MTIAVSALAISAPGAAAQFPPTIDLRDRADSRIDGATGARTGASVAASGGAVNDDALNDILIGAPRHSLNGPDSGAAYVVFGRAPWSPIDLGAEDAGYTIVGDAGDQLGAAVAGADVNRRGRADQILGVPGVDTVYVVHGEERSAGEVVNAESVTESSLDGFRITGEGIGASVAGAGDFNGDGTPDLIVGQRNTNSAYVIFGDRFSQDVDVTDLSGRGVQIRAPGGTFGHSVAAAGDVNGDGYGDVIVGAPTASAHGRFASGLATVVFGAAAGPPVLNLGEDSGRGFSIVGAAARTDTGTAVAGAGDVNGDGLADVLVGAPDAGESFAEPGSAALVFGAQGGGEVDLASLGARGYRITGIESHDRFGASVAGAGDLSGDGVPDALIGAPLADSGRGDAGAGAVVFGASSPEPVAADALGARGVAVSGAESGDRAGASVAGPGDVNGDGLADAVVGAPDADNRGRIDAGSVYPLLGAAPRDQGDPKTDEPPPPTTAEPPPVTGLPVRELRLPALLILPSVRRCIRRSAIWIRVRDRPRAPVRSFVVSFHGLFTRVDVRRYGRYLSRPIIAPMGPFGAELDIVVRLADGRTVAGTRAYARCDDRPRRRRR